MTRFLAYSFFLLPLMGWADNTNQRIDSLQAVIAQSSLDTNRVKTLIELSTGLYEMDEYEKAIPYAMQAKSLSQKLNYQSGIAASLRRIGAIYTEQGNYPMALESLLGSLHIYQSLSDQQGIFMVNNNLGTVYYFQQDYSKALNYYFTAYDYKSDGLTCSNIGMTYAGEMNFISSLSYFRKALSNFQLEKDSINIGTALINIGSVYDCLDQNDSALTYYSNALIMKQRSHDSKGQCDALGSIGDVYFKKKNYSDALKYELECLSLASQIGYLNGVKLTEEKLSQIYTALGDPAKSFEHYKNYVTIRDSMYNEEATKQTVRAEMNFQFQKEQDMAKAEQDKKDAIQQEQLKRRQSIIIAISCVFVLLLVFAFFQFRNNKRIRKAKDIISDQKKSIEHIHKELTDNINYAERIQKAILPSEEFLRNNFPEHFVLYRPKDVVSGDFYWAYRESANLYFATADCTGHGVSGAMMSMIGSSLLNETVIENGNDSPDMVLDSLRDKIIKSINHQGAVEERKDGMDMVFAKVNLNIMTLECACANNPLYIIRNQQIIEIKGNRCPVGKYVNNIPFGLFSYDLKEGDIIFTMSDGFCDQFSGETGKKLMSKRLKEWLMELSAIQDMKAIKEELEKRFINWMGSSEQIDDVTLFAIKV